MLLRVIGARLAWRAMHQSDDQLHDQGASAVEYGLLAAAVTAAFVVGTAGFNGVLGEVFHKALDGLGASTP